MRRWMDGWVWASEVESLFLLCNIEHDRSPEPLTTGFGITENGWKESHPSGALCLWVLDSFPPLMSF